MRPGPAGRNPERSRLWAARMTSAFRRASRVPFRTDEKEPKVRLRTLRLGRPARAAPGARYARRPLAGAPPRDPGLSPLRGPGPMGRNSKRNLREYLASTRRLPPLPTGTPAEGSIQVAGAPNGRSRMARITHGGKQRPFRAFARAARVRGEAAQFSASPWALRATQMRTCLPERTLSTVPETRRQRHCARGAAAGGMR